MRADVARPARVVGGPGGLLLAGVLPEGRAACLFEAGDQQPYERIVCACFDHRWLTRGNVNRSMKRLSSDASQIGALFGKDGLMSSWTLILIGVAAVLIVVALIMKKKSS